MFAEYARQDLVKDKLQEVTLWGLRNKNGTIPKVHVRSSIGNAKWEALSILDAGGEAIAEGDDDAKRADRQRRLRKRIAVALLAGWENVYRDTGEDAIVELDAEIFMAAIPFFAVEAIIVASRDISAYQAPFAPVEELAKK